MQHPHNQHSTKKRISLPPPEAEPKHQVSKKISGRTFSLANNHPESGVAEDTLVTVKEKSLGAKGIKCYQVFRYASPFDYLLMFLGLIFAVLTSALLPVIIFVYGQFFVLATVMHKDVCRQNNTMDEELILLEKRLVPTKEFYMLKLAIAYALSSFTAYFLFMAASANQLTKIRCLYMESILRKDFIWFDTYIDRNLTMRMTDDLTEMRSGLGECWPNLVTAIVSSIFLLGMSFRVYLEVALIGLVTVPILIVISYFKTKAETSLVEREQAAYEVADDVAIKILSRIRAVRVFEGEERELARYEAALFSPFTLWKVIIFGASFCALLIVVPMALRYLLYYLAIKYLLPTPPNSCAANWSPWNIQEAPFQSRFIMSSACVGFAAILLANLPSNLSRIRKSLQVAAEVFFTIDWKCKIDCMSDEGDIPRGRAIGKLQMANVFFDYPTNPKSYVLQNVTMFVFPGQVVTFFGMRGSGKSTLLKLFRRFYDPRFGKVRLDGMNMLNMNVSWIRSQVGCIPQEIELINTTVEENIRFGRLTANLEQVQDVCKQVHIHEDILALPNGYNTVVGEASPVKISNDLLKRISLARILLQNPSVILMDEFITNLDIELETLLLELVESMREKCTIVMTTSRFNSLVKTCDNIFALKEGTIVEQGSHESMTTKRGYYFKMLEESLEYTSRPKAYFNSQLQNNKFAQNILRKHKFNDDRDKVDYMEFLSRKSLHESVLLRHVVNKNRPIVLPRFIGGFHSYSNFTFHSDLYYDRWLVRNNLLRERDLQKQLLPLIKGEAEPDTFVLHKVDSDTVSTVDSEWEGATITSSYDSDIRVSSESVVRGVGGVMKRDLKQNLMHDFEMNHSAETLPGVNGSSIVSSQIHQPGKRGPNSLAITDTKESVGNTTVSYKTEDGNERISAPAIEDRFQSYFGWTVNSSIDNENLATQDSCLFWDLYNRNLILAKIKKASVNVNSNFGIREFLRLTKFSWPFLILIAITSTLFGGVLIFATDRTTRMINEFISNSSEDVLTYSSQYFIVGFIAMGVYFVQETILGFGMYHVNNKMRVELFKLFLKQPLEWFDAPENDLEFLRESLASDPPSTQMALFTICTVFWEVFGIIFGTVWVVYVATGYYAEAIWMALLLPLYLSINFYEGILRARFNSIVGAALKPVDNIVFDIMTNMRTVQVLHLEEFYLNKYRTAVRRFRHRGVPFLMLLRSASHALAKSGTHIMFALWMYAAGPELEQLTFNPRKNNHAEVYHFLLLAEIARFCFYPAAYALAALPSYRDIKYHSAIYMEVFRTQAALTQIDSAKRTIRLRPQDPPPQLSLKNVVFIKSESIDGFNGVTADFLPGQYVALVGSKVSGQSELLQVLLTTIAPLQGSILLNGISYEEIHDKCIRSIVGYVEMDPDLMDEFSIEDNIAYGDNSRGVALGEIKKAAEFVMIDKEIQEMKEKYETKLGDLPQDPKTFVFRQQLAFARALIQNPKILLVDEATTSLDARSTERLLATLQRLREGGRTMIVSSQRVESIRDAEVIYFLDKGQVKECGTHKNLMSAKGSYYELYMSQRLSEMH